MMYNTNDIAICASQRNLMDEASSLAQKLSLPLKGLLNVNENPDTLTGNEVKYLLSVVPNDLHGFRLELHFPAERMAPLYVDFQNRSLTYRQKFGGGRQQAIARAIGLKHGRAPRIIDATAGLGRDAFILGSLGCQVHMLERNPIIHALLQDGLRRLAKSASTAAFANTLLSLELAESQAWLKSSSEAIDTIYLDPMYPHRSKSALVKKEMRVLRQLVGDDLDINSVLDCALNTARNRVVVKRPKTADPIGQRAPSHSINTKNTRFDVYLKIS